MALLNVSDLSPQLPDLSEEEIQTLIDDAEALAALYAPCITNPAFTNKAAAKAIIRKAIVYDVQAQEEKNNIAREGTGAYSVEYRTPTRSGALFSNAQVDALKSLCPAANQGVYSLQFSRGY